MKKLIETLKKLNAKNGNGFNTIQLFDDGSGFYKDTSDGILFGWNNIEEFKEKAAKELLEVV